MAWSADADAQPAAHPGPPPRITVYTMGPGGDLFSHFGHAAACVDRPGQDQPLCYNYGTADFSTPVPLTWDVLRGRANFWVSRTTLKRMHATYTGEDRTLYSQPLDLSPAQARALAERFERDALPENKHFIYNHFFDNCTTRLRDHIDAVTDGRLAAWDAPPDAPPSFRHVVRQGFASAPPLLMLSELLLGRAMDRPPTGWELMFLPRHMRHAIDAQLAAPPQATYTRQGPVRAGDPDRGWHLLLALALLCAPLALGLARAERPALRRLGRVAAAALLTAVALVIDGLALASVLPELRVNELLLVFLPTDALLPWLHGARLRRYLALRLGGLGLVALLALAGVLIQPLWAPLTLALAWLAPMAWAERARRPAASDAGA